MDDQHDSEALLLSYADLGRRLGVSPDGARSRARRTGWPVIRDNRGRCRVRVHAVELADQPRAENDHQPEPTADATALLSELRRSHAEQIANLTVRLDRAEQTGQDWRAAAERDRARAELLEAINGRLDRRVDDLERALEEARRPWLVRVLAALRR
jgi:hypothetical protein